jgi:hypothetical protein
MIFIHKEGVRMMGIPFEYGDYLIIQGVIYQIDFDTAVNRYVCRIFALFIHQNDTKMNQDNTYAPFCERF